MAILEISEAAGGGDPNSPAATQKQTSQRLVGQPAIDDLSSDCLLRCAIREFAALEVSCHSAILPSTQTVGGAEPNASIGGREDSACADVR